MAKRKLAVDAALTEADVKKLCGHAHRVWDMIGGDCLEANEGKAMSRADVIEVVLDADRLFEAVRRDKEASPELKAFCTYDNARAIEELLKARVFTCYTYCY